MLEQLEPRSAIAAELLDPVIDKGECDLVETLSYPLPVIAIAEILGVEPEKRADFKRWSDEAVAQLGTSEGNMRQEKMDEMAAYFKGLFEERRAAPRGDLISGLVQAEMAGEKLNFDELIQMVVLLLVAGNETTTNLIGNAVQEFMEHPDQLAKVEADSSLIPSALEEVLRFSSPVQATVRRATRDIELSGKQVSADQQVVVWLAAANRDPEQFSDPLTFDVTRTTQPAPSLGMGFTSALRAACALEAKVAVEELLKRAKNFGGPTPHPPRIPTFIMRGVREVAGGVRPR